MSAHGYPTAALGIVFADDERKQKHDTRADRQHHVGVDIGQRLRLRQQGLINPVVSLHLRVGYAETGMNQALRQAVDLTPECGIVTGGVSSEL